MKNIRSINLKCLIFTLFLTALSFCWLSIKLSLFNNLEYSGDIFLQTQQSLSLYQGRGLLSDNYFAPNSFIHNYFILVLLGPLTILVGSYGLIFTSMAILLASFITAVSTLLKTGQAWHVTLATLLAIYFGPIGFWMFDDRPFGWHTEILFFPLGMLFVMSLYQESRLFLIWAALLILNREDGPILACCLHVLVILCKNDSLFPSVTVLKSIAKVCGVWFFLFAFSILTLRALGEGAVLRQNAVIENFNLILSNSAVRAIFVEELGYCFLLLAGFLIFYLFRSHYRFFLISLVCSLPLLLIISAASLSQLPDTTAFYLFGMNWPPRFVMPWTLFSCGLSLSLMNPKQNLIVLRIPPLLISILVAILSLSFQYISLLSVRHYDLISRVNAAFHGQNLKSSYFDTPQLSFIGCIANQLPLSTPVGSIPEFSAFFHRSNFIPIRKSQPLDLIPDLLLCTNSTIKNHCSNLMSLIDSENYKLTERLGIQIAVKNSDSSLHSILKSCQDKAIHSN